MSNTEQTHNNFFHSIINVAYGAIETFSLRVLPAMVAVSFSRKMFLGEAIDVNKYVASAQRVILKFMVINFISEFQKLACNNLNELFCTDIENHNFEYGFTGSVLTNLVYFRAEPIKALKQAASFGEQQALSIGYMFIAIASRSVLMNALGAGDILNPENQEVGKKFFTPETFIDPASIIAGPSILDLLRYFLLTSKNTEDAEGTCVNNERTQEINPNQEITFEELYGTD